MHYNFDWAYAYGCPQASAQFKQQPEDFVVRERLRFTPCGEGEHLFLRLRKVNCNTQWLARQLARLAKIAAKDVAYAGLKDRAAVTEQWFSLRLPKRQPVDFSALTALGDIEPLEQVWHDKKLRHAGLAANQFDIRLREVSQPQALETRLSLLQSHGTVNYFGPQRFGIKQANLAAAIRLLAPLARPRRPLSQAASTRPRRLKTRNELQGLYLSAARAYLFNQILSNKLSLGIWDQLAAGDVLMFVGSNSQFALTQAMLDNDQERNSLESRMAAGELSPSSALWGQGQLTSDGRILGLELQQANAYPELCRGLATYGLRQERRANRLWPTDLSWQWQGRDLLLSFQLPPGSYATAVLRELAVLNG